ncbi:MAG: hypothetical protein HKM24_06825, partial [Gammaproteobacteria bacterium]|nr:hypothetical protein [Gammaproteobacteria bacterium]
RTEVDSELNSRSVALSGEWWRAANKRFQWGISGQFGIVRFGDGLESKDVDQLLFGPMMIYRWPDLKNLELFAAALTGSDKEANPGSLYSRDLLGLRGSLSAKLNPQWRLSGNISYLASDYDGVFFPTDYDSPRQDDLLRIGGQLSYKPNTKWETAMTVSYTENDTEIDIFAYDRWEALLHFRRNW